MKRVLQNLKVPDRVKRAVLDIAGDSGILLNLHVNGFRTGPSIYQKASMRDGEWVQVYDELRNIYGSVFGKGKQTVLDYDVGGITQKLAEKAKVQPKQINFQEYITQLNRKRMLGEKAADDAESRGMKLLDDFYETWEKRLSSTGLVGSLAHYKNKSMLLDDDIEYRQGIVSELRKKKNLTETQKDRLSHNQNILSRLKAQKKDTDMQIKAMSDQRLMPANEEKFHPRYWKFDAIKSRREEFFDILFDWYSKNPFVYTVDKDSGALVRTRLSSNPDDISKRVNDTINKILNLDDVTLAYGTSTFSSNLIVLDEAIEKLTRRDKLKADVVKLRYFAGLTIEQTAEVLGSSPATVKRCWSYARAWLLQEIDK